MKFILMYEKETLKYANVMGKLSLCSTFSIILIGRVVDLSELKTTHEQPISIIK